MFVVNPPQLRKRWHIGSWFLYNTLRFLRLLLLSSSFSKTLRVDLSRQYLSPNKIFAIEAKPNLSHHSPVNNNSSKEWIAICKYQTESLKAGTIETKFKPAGESRLADKTRPYLLKNKSNLL